MIKLLCLEIIVSCLEKRKKLERKRELFKFIRRILIRKCFKKEIYNLTNFIEIIQESICHKMNSSIEFIIIYITHFRLLHFNIIVYFK